MLPSVGGGPLAEVHGCGRVSTHRARLMRREKPYKRGPFALPIYRARALNMCTFSQLHAVGYCRAMSVHAHARAHTPTHALPCRHAKSSHALKGERGEGGGAGGQAGGQAGGPSYPFSSCAQEPEWPLRVPCMWTSVDMDMDMPRMRERRQDLPAPAACACPCLSARQTSPSA